MTHAQIVTQYKQLLVHAHRVWGQSRRYFGQQSFEEYTGYTAVKYRRNISQASINRLQRKIDRVRGERARIKLAIDNLMGIITNAILSAHTTRGAIDIERTANFVRGRIMAAIEDNGVESVISALLTWAADYEAKIQRLILAIYDPEYNTNEVAGRRDAKGEIGRSKFYRTIESLMLAIGADGWESVYPSELPR